MAKILATIAIAAIGGLYVRWAIKPVKFAFQAGQMSANLDYSRDVRVLGHGLADAVGMLQDADIWHPKGARVADTTGDADTRAA